MCHRRPPPRLSCALVVFYITSIFFFMSLLPRTCQGFALLPASSSRASLLCYPTPLLRRPHSGTSTNTATTIGTTGRRKMAPTTHARSALLKRQSTTDTVTYDEEQARLFEEERIISVTFDDKPIKPISKKNGHKNKKGPPLHRAFSIFLFDTKGRLLLQKRAAAKITFPGTWTNTCCSHPLWNEAEMGADVNDPVLGCKRAAIRKLEHELGIPAVSLEPDDLTYMTRIHYVADSDPVWGEHEIDYIFLGVKDVVLDPNPNEVAEARYVTQAELKSMIRKAELHRGESQETLLAEEGPEEDGKRDKDKENVLEVKGPIHFTPWSRAIIERWLPAWWADVCEDKKKLDKHLDTGRIHRIGRVDP